MQKIKKKLVILAAALSLLAPAALAMPVNAAPNPVQQDIQDSLACGSNVDITATPNANCSKVDATTGSSLNDKVKKFLNILSAVVGVVAVIMIIYGGFRYVASGGKQESVTSAKNTILYAIVGLIIVALAQAIVHFVLKGTTT